MTSSPTPPALSTVLDQVRTDASANRFALWGRSTVIDEHTKVPSFSQPIFEALHAAAGIQARFPVGNAGLIHVYGYWFSDVLTPFGYKFDRWRDGALAHALKLPSHAFWIESPEHPSTTALDRVLTAIHPVLEAPAAGVVTADAQLTLASGTRHSRLVLCPPAKASALQPAALIYGIASAAAPPMSVPGTPSPTGVRPEFQLITAFPFSGDPQILATDFTTDPRPRWNAVVDP
ncbi:hypothetical protein ICL81_11360 [Leucobacter sp. cx-328]|uniref:hypothetical protein n=1 Tax=unclassified Leucobacter TaxID=2621730 RepID=UPI00165E822D|nr:MULTISPECIES: hypothetical protein [unclassified Leucobacter]MBC9945093.1 hypothetical protein [Leucobacter sp. cx-328]